MPTHELFSGTFWRVDAAVGFEAGKAGVAESHGRVYEIYRVSVEFYRCS